MEGRNAGLHVMGRGVIRGLSPEVVLVTSAHIGLPRTQSHGHRSLQGKLGTVMYVLKKEPWVRLLPLGWLTSLTVAKAA